MKKNKLSLSLILLVQILYCNTVYPFSIRPIPWVTHKAVLFLYRFMEEHPDAKVLEFGSGASTVWFAKRTKNLVSIEHSPSWFDYINQIMHKDPECFNVKIILHPIPYYSVCNDFPDDYFDLILVDGRNRKGCIKHSIRTLKHGGVLMLDNAERSYYKQGIDLLKGWQSVSANQPEPDTCGFTYPNWKTNWYIKP